MTVLLILGAGSLTRELATAIPDAVRSGGHLPPFRVVIGSRDRARAEWASALGRARARLADSAVTFDPVGIDWADTDRLAALIAAVAPSAIVHAASFQSAWSLGQPDGWSQLVRRAGYGVTAALQAALLPRLGRAVARSGCTPRVVNACYPDLVNAGASALGIDILCGIGNIALVAERIRLRRPEAAAVKLLAGHWDVGRLGTPLPAGIAPPPIWTPAGVPVPERLAGVASLAADSSLNNLNASVSAPAVVAIAAGANLEDLHLPGPLGLPGGYPVRLARGVPELALPPGIDPGWATAWNEERMKLDGARVAHGRFVRFAPAAAELLARHLPGLAEGFDLREVESVVDQFLDLRKVLLSTRKQLNELN